MPNTIKIFLASSVELKKDRIAFRTYINDLNQVLIDDNIYIDLVMWEHFIDAMSKEGLQSEYNKAIESCDLFIMLFKTKVGKYTEEEFEKAFKYYEENNRPLVYTYFKNTSKSKDEKDVSLLAFQNKLKELKHYQTEYTSADKLLILFREQFDKLRNYGQFGFNTESSGTQIPKFLSAGQPSVTNEFLGRDIALTDVKARLTKNGLLLINAEGGMGKTTLAAKYFNDNIRAYKHVAWLFCDNGIIEPIKTLAPKLNIDTTAYTTEEQLLRELKTAMMNINKPCLLVLDNANEEKHVEDFQKYFNGLDWHVLITTRAQNILPGYEYTLNHLQPQHAKTLFKNYHNENTQAFDELLDKFLSAVGYNTLMIEVFSKNVHELSVLGETFADALQLFEEKGLFLGERSFEIKTAWANNVHKEAATSDQVLEVLYDLSQLADNERKLLVNIALLPAESHNVPLLVDVFAPIDKIAFAKQLKNLAQRGWLNTDGQTFRMSPVVQQIVLAKNKNALYTDASTLIEKLSNKLQSDGASTLLNVGSYAAAQPFAAIAKSLTSLLPAEENNIALLMLLLSDYYKNTGNFQEALNLLNKSADIFYKIDKRSYILSLMRSGDLFMKWGDKQNALSFFEEAKTLSEDLINNYTFDAWPKEQLINACFNLSAYYTNEKNFEKASQYISRIIEVNKMLIESDPANTTYKNDLAGSYERQGVMYRQQGLHEKALPYFKEFYKLEKVLVDENPLEERFKISLAVAYYHLGKVYQDLKDLKNSLDWFKKYEELRLSLYENNMASVPLHDGLAIAYSSLSSLYKDMNDPDMAKDYLLKAETIWLELTERVPESATFKNYLTWVKEQLEKL